MYLTILGGAFVTWLVLVMLFAPNIPYCIQGTVDLSSDQFVHVLESTCLSAFKHGNKIDIFTNGPAFYPAMLEAIAGAKETVNMECYMFKRGEVAEKFVEALAARARDGVRVSLVMDAIGSLGNFRYVANRLRPVGCRVELYQRLSWHRLARLNNRTHRELLVIDGQVAFVGGAGVADWWAKPLHGKPIWRDMAARIEGPIVSYIQGIVAENWLECCGEILTGPEIFKTVPRMGNTSALAVKSSPADRATVSRVLFQMLMEGSNRRVLISTPYFLPDKALRRTLARVVKRGVEITVIVPGRHTDQRWVRMASRRAYGWLLKKGVRIFEYEPGMTHTKVMVIDDLWSIIGSTNFDNRSFEHNDEVNVAIRDKAIAARLTSDLEGDLAKSRQILLKAWHRRPVWEQLIGRVAWLLERQQ
jgi:cardiolipin synthase